MCYPCTQCNGCGKFDTELFSYLKPAALRCLGCGSELPTNALSCPECGKPCIAAPGQETIESIAS